MLICAIVTGSQMSFLLYKLQVQVSFALIYFEDMDFAHGSWYGTINN